jgi:signal transduction histidine kinase/ActR/RegA family two-component response regulator/HAMP domain-containing protein
MMNLENLSIKGKLVGIILTTVLLAVGLGFTTVITINIRTLKQDLVNNVLMNATLVSEYCVVPLTFEDKKALTKSLQTLRSIPAIECGVVYDSDNNLLATFRRATAISYPPLLDLRERWYFEGDYLHVIQAIVHKEHNLGKLHLRASTRLLDARITGYILTMVGIALGLIVLSYFIALKLQAIISKPILSLAAVTREITQSEDYSTRVYAQRSDEIGELYAGFNNMLEYVSQRERERDKARQALEYRNIVLSTQIENSPDGILIVDEHGHWTSLNSRFIEIWDIPENIQKASNDAAALDVVAGKLADPAEFSERVKSIYDNREASSQDELNLKDGQVIYRYSAPMRGADGRHYGRVWFFRDITETKRLQALESRAERLETAGTIAGQVAHDFNNLLSPIVAYPEFIREDLPDDHSAHAYLDAIEEAGRKIAEINQDLLTMSRRGHYNLSVLDLNRVVQQSANEMELAAKSTTFKLDLCDDLMSVKGGEAQIHRMLTNLLVNAQDAMDNAGEITIKTENFYADDTSVAFGRVPKGEYVKLTVSDNGCGIPEDIIQNILDPFFSTKTADKKRGSGLGLSVVDAVMKDHGGYLDLVSQVDHGTSFFLYFPVTRDDVAEDRLEPLVGGTELILVVDDDTIQRDVSLRLLTKLGYQATAVESGRAAVEFLRHNPQDLIVLDMVMPGGIDGTETYRRILEFAPCQKAIILSGFSESDRVLEAQRLGAGVFVRKPVTRKILASAVRSELSRKIGVPVL